MKKDDPLDVLVSKALNSKRYEPTQRLHDFYGYHGHRFPIKGGITATEVMRRQLCDESPLLKRLMRKGK
jgi:hypothetical protein